MDREVPQLRSNPVLPPVIIEHIKKRELEERRRREQAPRLQLPMPLPAKRPRPRDEDDVERGVVVVDLF